MSNPHMLPLPPQFLKETEAVKRLDEAGRLYYLEINEDYYQLESYISMLVTPGCSTMAYKNTQGDACMGRNYDFAHYPYNKKGAPETNTMLGVVVKCANPKARFKSIGVADGFWMDQKNGTIFAGSLDDGKTDISALAFIPYLCMDAANEAGLAVSIMHLCAPVSWDEVDYIEKEQMSDEDKEHLITLEKSGEVPATLETRARYHSLAVNTADKKAWRADNHHAFFQNDPNKKTVYHPVLMRMMVDLCANVDEAIHLASSINIASASPDSDYHIFVADKSGRSVVLEWIDGELKVIESNHGANFYLGREDYFGYGHDRDTILKSSLDKFENTLSDQDALFTMALASQNNFIHKKEAFTYWTSMYNLSQKSLTLYLYLDYKKAFNFSI